MRPSSAISILLACGACAGAACGSKKEGAGAGAGSAGSSAAAAAPEAPKAPAALAGLSVKFSGKPVVMQRAFAKRMEPDRYQIYLSSSGGSCRELIDNLFDAKDRVDVLFTVTPRVNADGKQYLQITDVYEGAPTMKVAPGAAISVTGAAAQGEPVQVTADFTAAAQEAGAGGLSIEVRGPFTAEGCGARDRDPSGVPRAMHPTTATVTFANQRLELKGATVSGAGKERDLVLSTGVKDCSPITPWASVVLRRTGGSWSASGTWLESELRAVRRPALGAALGAAGKSDDGPTVQLSLSGAGDLGGYAVSIEGAIEAIDCGP